MTYCTISFLLYRGLRVISRTQENLIDIFEVNKKTNNILTFKKWQAVKAWNK